LDATLALSLALLILSVSSLGWLVALPFLFWKLFKLEGRLDALDATLADALTPKP
jgi:hypothetical protein